MRPRYRCLGSQPRSPPFFIHRAAQPISPEATCPHDHRPTHRIVKDNHRVIMAPSPTAVLTHQLRILPRMGDALNQRNRCSNTSRGRGRPMCRHASFTLSAARSHLSLPSKCRFRTTGVTLAQTRDSRVQVSGSRFFGGRSRVSSSIAHSNHWPSNKDVHAAIR